MRASAAPSARWRAPRSHGHGRGFDRNRSVHGSFAAYSAPYTALHATITARCSAAMPNMKKRLGPPNASSVADQYGRASCGTTTRNATVVASATALHASHSAGVVREDG